MSLSYKQQVFIDFYLKTWNATEAYSITYPRATRESARRAASLLLLTNIDVQEAIKTRIAEHAMTADEVLSRLADMARASVETFVSVDNKGRLDLDLKKAASSGALRLIKTIKPTRYGLELELHDQMAALVHLGKHLQLFEDTEKPPLEVKLKIEYINKPIEPEPTDGVS